MDTNKQYDEIVRTIMQNVLAERNIANRIVLWDFQEEQAMDKLYFNVASIIADIYKENIYLQMPLIPYLKMKWRRRKGRKNLRWIGHFRANQLPEDAKTSVFILMDYVREYYDLPYEIFEDINNEYYGWI